MLKPDKIDKELLSLLTINGRSQLTTIGKLMNQSSEKLRYRIKRLKKNNIIYGFKPSINVSKLGYKEFHIFIKIKFSKYCYRKKILEKLKKQDKIFQVDTGQGDWNIRFFTITKKKAEIKNLLKTFNEIIEKKEILEIENKKYILKFENTKTSNENLKIPRKDNLKELDYYDWKIIKLLYEKPRMTMNNINSQIPTLSRTQLKSRMKNIKNNEVFYQFIIDYNLHSNEANIEILLLKINNFTQKEIEKIENIIPTRFVATAKNHQHIEIIYEYLNLKEKEEYLMNLFTIFNNKILDLKTIHMFENIKKTKIPLEIFDEMIEKKDFLSNKKYLK